MFTPLKPKSGDDCRQVLTIKLSNPYTEFRTHSLEELDRISHALHLGSDLPENDREEYNEALASRVGDREPFDRLIEGLRALPTQELQSKALRSRLTFAYHVPKMAPKITNKQLDQLKEFLTDREKRLLEIGRRMFRDRIQEDPPDE